MITVYIIFMTFLQLIEAIDVVAVEGQSINVAILCNLDRQFHPLYWDIQGRVYDLDNVPSIFEVRGHEGLLIPTVDRRMNGLRFQCFTIDFSREGNLNPGTVTQLTVYFSGTEGQTSGAILKSSLQKFPVFYYPGSLFEPSGSNNNNMVLHWLYSPDPTSPCYGSNSRYQIRLYTKGEIDRAEDPQELIAHQIFNANATIISIPYDGSEDYFQISAFNENLHCSDSMNLETFANGQVVDVLYDRVNELAMFELPEDLINNRSLQLIWFKNNTTQCVCPPVEQFISRCACNMEYPNNMITIVNNTLTVSNLTFAMDENISIYFVSSVSSGCHSTCNLRSMVKQYKIITTQGFPAAPVVTLEYRTICFTIPNNFVSAEVYEFNLMDSIGSSTKLSGIYNISDCFTITSDLYPDVCGPFQLSITAINEVGRETTQQTIDTENSGSATPCDCYRRKEKISNITSTVGSTSAEIEIGCKNENKTFTIVITEADNATNVQHISASCNVTQRVNSFQPSTIYIASVVIEERLMCTLNNMFKTNSGKEGLILGLAVGLSVAIFLLMLVVCVCTIIVFRYCSKHYKGGYKVRQSMDENGHIHTNNTDLEFKEVNNNPDRWSSTEIILRD